MDQEYLLALPPHELEKLMLNLTNVDLSVKLLRECAMTLAYEVAVDRDISEDPTAGDFEELSGLIEKSVGELEC